MLDKFSKTVLNYMVDKANNTSFVWSFSELTLSQCSSTIYDLATDIHKDVEDVRACIRYLHSLGYIEYQTRVTSKDTRTIGFHLSHKGLHNIEIFGLQIKSFFMCSIITPILVSFLTSALCQLFF